MFSSGASLHTAFLDGIRKGSTSTVKPSVFTRIWNEWAMISWVTGNLSMREGVELTQKQIDDLQELYIRSKLVDKVTANPLAYYLPNGTSVRGYDLVNTPTTLSALPKFVRPLKVRWVLNYNYNECGKTGQSSPLKSKYMRSDEEGVITESVYRKPSDSRLYHKMIDGKILFIGGVSQPAACHLDYIRYPNEMTCSSETISYTPDLNPEQLAEVLTLAVRIYLERVTDPRYKSFLNEEMIRSTTQV